MRSTEHASRKVEPTAEQIRAERERLLITLASIRDAVISTDAEGRVTYLNGVAEDLTGWSLAEASGRPLHEIFQIVDEHSRRARENPAGQALRDGETVALSNHVILIARDGKERPIDERAAPILDISGNPVGAVLVFRDVTERKRAEEAQARLAAIVESSDDAIISKTLDGTILSWNSGAERLFGHHAAEAIGRPITLIVPADRLDEETWILDRVRCGDRIHHFETVRVTKDGRLVNISLTVSPVRDAEGRIVGASKVARDITQRKHAEEAIRQRDERIQLFLGNATDYAVIICDSEDRIVEWLGGAERITGWRSDEVQGKLVDLIFTDQDREAGVPGKEAETAVKTGRAESARWHVRRDGSRFFAEGVAVALRGEAGELRGIGKVFRDATSQKVSQAELSRDALLLASVRDSVVVTDPKGIVTYWNEGASQLFGWNAEEMVGRNICDRFKEPTRSLMVVQFHERTSAVEWCGEYQDYRKDGSSVWIDARVCKVTDAEGAIVGVLEVSHEITERKCAEDAMRDANRKKDEFIAMLAHELRNPLAPIRNGLQVMRFGASDPDSMRQASTMMERQLGHMVRLIDDLLDVSRISRNKMELRKERVTLSDVVTSAVETARPLIDAGGHSFSVSLPHSPILLDADLTRLAQVFGNLLCNSAKYTPPGGHIWLEAKQRGNDAFISISDNGIGIPPESLANVFDMFTQVDRSIERNTGGLGIGLALVKGLVEMHNGTVSVVSPGLGRGTTFTVRLPALENACERAEENIQEEPSTAGMKRRFLVVDDNKDSATTMAMMLKLVGNEVRTANDGFEALNVSEQFRPQVILMDLGMPKLNGYKATRLIREQPWGRSITIIALTGWGQENDRAQSREAGCNGHLVKPVSLPDLEKLLIELTGKSAVAKSNG